MMRLDTNIDHFAAESLSVTRAAASTLGANGLWTPGATTTVAVSAVVVPMGGRQMDALPEGWRTRDPLIVYAKSALKTVDESAKTDGDRFARGGATYEVQTVQDWSQQAGYWSAVAIKVATS